MQTAKRFSRRKTLFIWAALLGIAAIPLGFAVSSPLLAWRTPVYIASGFAGALAMTLLLFQPLLAARLLPGLSAPLSGRIHRFIGIGLVVAVLVHVIGLAITSPPDVVDALTFTSPTAFSAWGVIAMWALFTAAGVAALRRRWRLSPRTWRRIHIAFAVTVIAGSVVHALLIEGTMEQISKAVLCLFVVVAAVLAVRRIYGRSISERMALK